MNHHRADGLLLTAGAQGFFISVDKLLGCRVAIAMGQQLHAPAKGRGTEFLHRLIGIDAVSYTHLDVYKRQLQGRLLFQRQQPPAFQLFQNTGDHGMIHHDSSFSFSPRVTLASKQRRPPFLPQI